MAVAQFRSTQRPAPDLARVVAGSRALARAASARAGASDIDGGFPAEDIVALHEQGLLTAPLPPMLGGADLGIGEDGARALADVLRAIGSGNLSLGRLYEGHVNAVLLVRRYGTSAQVTALGEALDAGVVMGVWAAENPAQKLEIRTEGRGRRLSGKKILASGAGHLDLALVPACDEAGASLLVLVRTREPQRVDQSGWTVQGMRASATGTIDLTGLAVEPADIIGHAGDYLRQPFFSGGAWRFCAVQLGAMEALLDLFRGALTSRSRDGDPIQRMRIAESAIAVETARLWVDRAARMTATDGDDDADRVVAYVHLTRLVVERAALDLMDRLQRGIGLQAFGRPADVERIARDLRTYLRQPAPDGVMLDAAATILAGDRQTHKLWAGLA